MHPLKEQSLVSPDTQRGLIRKPKSQPNQIPSNKKLTYKNSKRRTTSITTNQSKRILKDLDYNHSSLKDQTRRMMKMFLLQINLLQEMFITNSRIRLRNPLIQLWTQQLDKLETHRHKELTNKMNLKLWRKRHQCLTIGLTNLVKEI